MLNQYAVDNPTLPVNQRFFFCPPHPIPGGMLSRSLGMPRRKNGPPSISGTRTSSSAPYPQELNQWNSSTEEPLHSSTVEKSERPEQNQDLRSQSGPSAKDSVIFSGGDYSKNYGQTNNDCRFPIFILTNSQHQQHSLVGRKIQDRGMYLFTISNGSNAMDQRSGDG